MYKIWHVIFDDERYKDLNRYDSSENLKYMIKEIYIYLFINILFPQNSTKKPLFI